MISRRAFLATSSAAFLSQPLTGQLLFPSALADESAYDAIVKKLGEWGKKDIIQNAIPLCQVAGPIISLVSAVYSSQQADRQFAQVNAKLDKIQETVTEILNLVKELPGITTAIVEKSNRDRLLYESVQVSATRVRALVIDSNTGLLLDAKALSRDQRGYVRQYSDRIMDGAFGLFQWANDSHVGIAYANNGAMCAYNHFKVASSFAPYSSNERRNLITQLRNTYTDKQRVISDKIAKITNDRDNQFATQDQQNGLYYIGSDENRCPTYTRQGFCIGATPAKFHYYMLLSGRANDATFRAELITLPTDKVTDEYVTAQQRVVGWNFIGTGFHGPGLGNNSWNTTRAEEEAKRIADRAAYLKNQSGAATRQAVAQHLDDLKAINAASEAFVAVIDEDFKNMP